MNLLNLTRRLKPILCLFALSISVDMHGQLPVLSYTGYNNNYCNGGSPVNISITNTGGAVDPRIVTTFAGSGTAGFLDATGIAAQFNRPAGIVRDAAGNFFVCEFTNNRIRKITPTGVVTVFAGSGVASSIDGTGTAATFNQPYGIAIDTFGNFFVTEWVGRKIRKITPAGVVTTFAGSGAAGAVDATGILASFNLLLGIAIDKSNNLYVADYGNNKIRKVTPAAVVTTFAGSGAAGALDGTGIAATFSSPSGLCIDTSGNLWLAAGFNQKLRKITPGAVVTTIAGSGAAGGVDGTGAAATFNFPVGVSIDPSNNLFVSDLNGNKLRKVTPGAVVTSIVGNGAASSIDGIGTAATVYGPFGSIYVPNVGLYLVDYNGHKIRRVAMYKISPALPAGMVFNEGTGAITGIPTGITATTTYTVTGYNNFGSDTANITFSTGVLPASPTVTFLQSFPPGSTIANLTATGTAIQWYDSASGGAPMLSSTALISENTYYATQTISGCESPRVPVLAYIQPVLSYPSAASNYCSAGSGINLNIVNTGGAVEQKQVALLAGSTSGFADGTGAAAMFNLPLGLIKDAGGNIFVADYINNRIRKITPAGVVTTFAGSGTIGSLDGTGTAAQFNNPTGLTIDTLGNLYIADYQNHKIRKITPAGVVTTFAGSGVAGALDGTGIAAQFNKPNGLTIDLSGNLYIADEGNNKIRKITPAGVVTTFAGSGVVGSIDGVGIAAQFNYPEDTKMDALGNVYVADYGNSRIRKITPSGVVSTYAFTGIAPGSLCRDAINNFFVAAYASNYINKISPEGSVTTLVNIPNPGGSILDNDGNLIVTEFVNTKIRKISNYSISPALPTGMNFNTATGAITGIPTVTTPTTTYVVTGANAAASDTATFTFSTLINPSAPTGTGFQNFCNATPAVADLVATGTAIQWYAASSGGSALSLVTPLTSATNYYATQTINGCESVLRYKDTVNINAVPPTGSGIQTFCNLNPTVADLVATGTGLKWYASPTGGTQLSLATVLTSNTNYYATQTINGCESALRYKDSILLKYTSAPTGTGFQLFCNIGTPTVSKLIATGTAIQWYAAASGGSPLAPATALTTNAKYYASQTINGCESTLRYKDSVVFENIATPTGAFKQNFPLGTTLASVVVAGSSIKWLDTATGSTFLPTSTTLVSENTYFAASQGPNCLSNKLAVLVYLNPVLTYPTYQAQYCTNTPIANINLTNTGGAVEQMSVNTYSGSAAGLVNGPIASALYNAPYSIATDKLGNKYMTEYSNGLVRKITPAGVVSTFATLLYASGIAIDTSGNVFVSQQDGGHAIYKITPLGVVTLFAGNTASGYINASGAAARFNQPIGLAFDLNGNLLVAEVGNHRIRKITPAGVVTTLAGTGVIGALDTISSLAQFNSPLSIAVDGIGNIYIGESGNYKIRKITPSGVVSTHAGSGVSGSVDGNGTNAQFIYPRGLKFDASGNLIVVDRDAYRIRKISPERSVITIAGSGVGGALNGFGAAAQFYVSRGVAFDSAGNVFISEEGNYRIRQISNYQIVPALPAGLSLNPVTGAISGTPTAVTPTTTYTLTGGNNGATDTANVTFATISVATPPTGSANQNFAVGATVANLVAVGPSIQWYDSEVGGSPLSASTPLISGNTYFASQTTICGESTTRLAVLSYVSPLLSYAGFNSIYCTNKSITPINITNSGGAVENRQVSTVAGSGVAGSIDGTGIAAQFNNPTGVVIDALGNAYVAEYGANKIRKITPAGVVTTFAGSGVAGGLDGTGVAAQFNGPSGITIDATGNLYIADQSGHKIRKVTPAAVVTTLAGSGVAGFADNTGVLAQFNIPSGIAVDDIGNLYVSDQFNNRIRKITPAGVVTTFAGSGVAGAADGIGLAAQFNWPNGILLDSLGNLYVSEQTNKKVRKITPAGVVTTIAGSGVAGTVDANGTNAQFSLSTSIAMDATGCIYVADYGGSIIRKINTEKSVSTIAGSIPGYADGNGTNALFNNPWGIATDINDNIYVGDITSHRIRKVTKYSINPALPAGLVFNQNTGEIKGTPTAVAANTTYIVTGANGSSTDTATLTFAVNATPATPTGTFEQNFPSGALVGNLVATGTSIKWYDSLSSTSNLLSSKPLVSENTYFATQTVSGCESINRLAVISYINPVLSYLGYPSILCTGGPNANINITNTGGEVEQKIVSTYTGSTLGAVNGTLATSTYNTPYNSVFDANGNMYVSDNSSTNVRKITPAGVVSTFATGINGPSGIVVDNTGNIFVLAQYGNMVYKITPAGVLSVFAGSGVAGYLNGTGTSAQFNTPIGLVIDKNNNLYVGDYGNHTIRKITPAGVVTSFAGNGVSGYVNANGTLARFASPSGLAIDTAGNIYVGDLANFRIRKISPSADVTTYAGSGVNANADGYMFNAQFSYPRGLKFDTKGNLFVSDYNSHMVRKITPEQSVVTVAGNGTAGSTNGIGAVALFNLPRGISSDTSGNIYIMDAGNYRIRKMAKYSISPALPAGLIFDQSTASIKGAPTVATPLTSYIVTGANNNSTDTALIKFSTVISPSEPVAIYKQVFTPGTTVASLVATGTSLQWYDTAVAGTPLLSSTLLISGKTYFVTQSAGGCESPRLPVLVYINPVLNYTGYAANYCSGTAIPIIPITNTGGAVEPKQTADFATLAFTTGSVIDGSGNLYACSFTGNRIHKITPAGVVTVFAGSGVAGSTDGIATVAQFNGPYAITLDTSNNLYVSDFFNNKIRKITPGGVVSTFAGSGVAGYANGTGIAAQFSNPIGITIDPSGNLYIADYGNHKIRKITQAGVVSLLAGGVAGYVDGIGSSALFSSPTGIVLNREGDLVIADYNNHRIRKLTMAGVATTFAGSGTIGNLDGRGTAAQFNGPFAITADSLDNYTVVELTNHVIRKVNKYGLVTNIAGSGAIGSTNGNGANALFNYPAGVSLDNTNSIYIGDRNNSKVRKIANYNITPALPAGLTLNVVTGTISGTPTATTASTTYIVTGANSGATDTATLTFSTTVSPSAPEAPFVQKFTNPNTISSLTATGTSIKWYDGASGGPVLTSPTALVSGNTYFASQTLSICESPRTPSLVFINPDISYSGVNAFYCKNNSIAPINLIQNGGESNDRQVINYAGTGVVGSINGDVNTARFNNPTGMVMDALGNTFIADYSNHLIRKIDAAGNVTTFAGSGVQGSTDGNGSAAEFNFPIGIAIDAVGDFYVSDYGNHKIRKITSAGVVTTLAGTGVQGNTNGIGTVAQFYNPRGIKVSSTGAIFVADENNHLIRKITTTGVVSTFAGNGTAGNLNGNGTAAQFNGPSELVFDPLGNMYVTDKNNHAIRKITTAADVTTLAGNGISGYLDTIGSVAQFNQPIGITMDINGNIYVADFGNRRVRLISEYAVVTTIAGSGIAGTANGNGTAAEFNNPIGVCVDASNNLMVSDFFNNKIRKIVNFTISPNLPTGMVFNNNNGQITGTPTVASTKTTYVVTSANGAATDTAALSFATLCSIIPSITAKDTIFCKSNNPAVITVFSVVDSLPSFTYNWTSNIGGYSSHRSDSIMPYTNVDAYYYLQVIDSASGVQGWDTAFVKTSIVDPISVVNGGNVGSEDSLTYGCTDVSSGWTYYSGTASLDPTKMYFAIHWDTNYAARAAAKVKIGITPNWVLDTSDPTGMYMRGTWVMKKYWNVDLNGSSMTTPVRVRFYFDPADSSGMMDAALTYVMQYASLLNHPNLEAFQWFKTQTGPYVPGANIDSIGVERYNNIALTVEKYGSENGAHYVQFQNVTSFSGGSGAGGAGSGTPLPVTWLSFDAKAKDRDAVLAWSTASERNNDYFVVERSIDGVNFNAIKSVKGAGNSLVTMNYNALDKEAASLGSLVYYRIKQVDFDGQVDYSRIRAVSFNKNSKIVVNQIYPNPFSNEINVNYTSETKESVDITVFDAKGQMVQSSVLTSKLGENEHKISLPHLQSGMYIVKVTLEGEIYQYKMIKGE